ncbi:MAG TPA: hypothetical protein VHZ73_12590 [Vicinamibacterales bacterium]|jgi:4-amino-4-deoxy-L-arabinose transferase-like glycosyltransferase|nr:hypothetical protein [Vicinamibacterales bacterium]
MTATRASLLVVLACFCLPLFIGLGRGDLQTDEAIYSFSVDRMLESGDWLAPKGSPYEEAPFLEKPPLKFWIVALPIKLGLLPHDEFGLRFWDAVFGSAAFLYLCALGCALAGPVCGIAAVLTMFACAPLLFEHGLRGNYMEGPLFLCYVGGMYHYIRAMRDERRQWRHAAAVAVYFALGFMTKFVAAIFLPLVIGCATLVIPQYRQRVARAWKAWAAAGALATAFIAPWFVYASGRFGERLWDVMLKAHVYTRMTSYLEPQHVQPWWYYWASVYQAFWFAGSVWLVLAGIAVLAVQAVKRRWPEALVLLLWFFVPMVIISAGTSKLIHYTYPFLPPLALGAGYCAALMLMLAPAPLERMRRPRAWLIALAIAAGAVALGTAFTHELRVQVGPLLVRNALVLRPALLAVAAALLAKGGRAMARACAIVIVLALVPISAYVNTLGRLTSDPAPIRNLRDCLLKAQQGETAPGGLYVDVPDSEMWHPVYYYLRQVQPWTRAQSSGDVRIGPFLDPKAPKPVLISRDRYQQFLLSLPPDQAFGPSRPGPALVRFQSDVILLPGAYGLCGPPST